MKLISLSTLPRLATLLVCVALYVIASFRFDGFATLQVFVNFLTDNAYLGIVAVGMTFVILSGGIDLSVGSVIALVSISMAVLIEQKDWHPATAGLTMLVAGTLFGTIMGLIIHVFNLPPFLVTLAGLFMGRGLALVTSLESIQMTHPWYNALLTVHVPLGSNASATLVPIVYVAVVIVAMFVARYTTFGRNVYALGGNEDAAVLMGVPVGKTRVGVYAVSGLAGFVSFHNAFPYLAERYHLKIVAVIEEYAGKTPGEKYLRLVADKLRTLGIKTIFSEPQLNARVADVLASEVGARVGVLDPYGTENTPGRDTYIGVMKYNAQELKKAFQAQQ